GFYSRRMPAERLLRRTRDSWPVRHTPSGYRRRMAKTDSYAGAGGLVRRRAPRCGDGDVAAHAVSRGAFPAHHAQLRLRAPGAGVGARAKKCRTAVPRCVCAVGGSCSDVFVGSRCALAITHCVHHGSTEITELLL